MSTWIEAYNFHQFNADRLSPEAFEALPIKLKLAVLDEACDCISPGEYREAAKEERRRLRISAGIDPVEGQIPLPF